MLLEEQLTVRGKFGVDVGFADSGFGGSNTPEGFWLKISRCGRGVAIMSRGEAAAHPDYFIPARLSHPSHLIFLRSSTVST